MSDHFDGERFYNPGKPMNKSFSSFLKWRLTSERGEWPEYQPLPVYDKPPERVAGSKLRISYIGHVSLLLQTQGKNILFDPVWSDRASPFSWLGPKRVHPPGVRFEDLPPIDIVLISHNHYDHLDLATLDRIWKAHSAKVIVPLGNDTIITGHNPAIEVEAYDWGQSVQLDELLTIQLEPMHHWSARGVFDRNKALWAAFVLSTGVDHIYLVGDTGYGDGDYFKAALKKYGRFKLAVLPFGDYDPAWFMAYGHMAPRDCVRAFFDLGKPLVLPIHYNTFPLADTGYGVPLQDLQKALQQTPEAAEKFKIVPAGASLMLE